MPRELRSERCRVAPIGLGRNPFQRSIQSVNPREDFQITCQHYLVHHLRHLGMSQTRGFAFTVELLEHVSKPQLDRRAQAECVSDVPRNLAMHHGQRRGLTHGTQACRA
ncbi:hypothetical protein D9M70_375410 [compost metagenome]